MEFGRVFEPDPGNDVAIACKPSALSCQIQSSAVPLMRTLHAIEFKDPVLPLAQHVLKNPDSVMKKVSFPFLVDLYHAGVVKSEAKPRKCEKCRALVTGEACPFCSDREAPPCYVSWPRKSAKEPVFVFLVVGNTTDLFYEGIRNFPHPMILMRYEESFVFYRVENGHFREYHMIEECELASSAVMRAIGDVKLPKFPDTKLYRVDLKAVVERLIEMLPDVNNVFHVVVFNSLPHTCIDGVPEKPGVTVSVLSTNCINCNCVNVCERTGGHFLPHTYSVNMSGIQTVCRHSIRTRDVNLESREAVFLYPGQLLVQNGMPVWTNKQFVNAQIIVKTNDTGYCFTLSLKSEIGMKTLMYEMAVPNLLLTEKPVEFFTHMLQSCTHTAETLNVPHSLRYFMLFPPYAPTQRTISSVMSTRPFVVQFKPTLRVPDIVSARLCTTLTVMLILHRSTIYVWVGSDIPKSTWLELIGVENNTSSTSFEIVDMPPTFASPLWQCIRSLRQLLQPHQAPVIIIPSESGRRDQILQILAVDQINNENTLLNKYGALAASCL